MYVHYTCIHAYSESGSEDFIGQSKCLPYMYHVCDSHVRTFISTYIDPYPYPQANGDQVSNDCCDLSSTCILFEDYMYVYIPAHGMHSTNCCWHERRYWMKAATIEYRGCKYCYKCTFLLSYQLVECIDVVWGHMLILYSVIFHLSCGQDSLRLSLANG